MTIFPPVADPASRSANRTFRLPRFFLCKVCYKDWSMLGPNGGLRKLFCVLALIFVGIASLPQRTHAQSGTQIQINDLSKRLDRLDDVNENVKALTVRVDQIQEMQREASDNQRWVTFGLLAAFAGMLLNAFGIKFRGKTAV